jgi:hypothetical protein
MLKCSYIKISSWFIFPLKTVHTGIKKAKKIKLNKKKKSHVILNFPEGSSTGILPINSFKK